MKTIEYEIDSMDWSSGKDDREKCEQALSAWFEGLTYKTRLAIFYAQRCFCIGMLEWDDCPWLMMVSNAETRIKKRYAPWLFGHGSPNSGYNLFLWTHSPN